MERKRNGVGEMQSSDHQLRYHSHFNLISNHHHSTMFYHSRRNIEGNQSHNRTIPVFANGDRVARRPGGRHGLPSPTPAAVGMIWASSGYELGVPLKFGVPGGLIRETTDCCVSRVE